MKTLTVDLDSPVPVYEQIRTQVAALVSLGVLNPGDRLPSSRNLARDLGVAVGTVQRAYRELEAAGTVSSRPRTGTVVAATTHRRSSVADQRSFADLAAQMVARGRELGLDDSAILDVVTGLLQQPVDAPRTHGLR
ncbi:GntR family transcriptional regulator [Oerskovia turbata]|uniref:GntR family transcriptional regulator n=1 Tax=Oerskovia turbata TaxID=1713 RepID=A0A4Q1KRQ6_9CELL|nr:GntR family transcriptional regulator [Oerskovia turbata]RXR25281.1 GntR family transcriptional regulator [Oerskovia turbata]RXR32778.1 GntR family transcriptional regulator [Oerskovia turbata]TGJ95544.1 GntR family transcriptional regulator [Actinotalea fermentans ATCC 43279 = JCM 9966 = DSM 3133]